MILYAIFDALGSERQEIQLWNSPVLTKAHLHENLVLAGGWLQYSCHVGVQHVQPREDGIKRLIQPVGNPWIGLIAVEGLPHWFFYLQMVNSARIQHDSTTSSSPLWLSVSVGYLYPLFVRDSLSLTILADICQYSWQLLLSVNCKPMFDITSLKRSSYTFTHGITQVTYIQVCVCIYIYSVCVGGVRLSLSLSLCAHTCIQ